MITLEIVGDSAIDTGFLCDWPAKVIACPHCNQRIEFMYALTSICPNCHKVLGVDVDMFKDAFSRLLFFRKLPSEYSIYGEIW